MLNPQQNTTESTNFILCTIWTNPRLEAPPLPPDKRIDEQEGLTSSSTVKPCGWKTVRQDTHSVDGRLPTVSKII